MQVIYKKSAQKALLRMQPKLASMIMSKIDRLAVEGFSAHVDIKPLKGEENGYRMRQGDWRVILHIDDDVLYVDDIRPRGGVYK